MYFIKQIQLTLDNLNLTKNKGLTEGLSNIFIENYLLIDENGKCFWDG